MSTSRKPPTPQDVFEKKTSLLMSVVVNSIRMRRFDAALDTLSDEQVEWFEKHCDLRVRCLHANRDDWRKRLNGSGNAGRDLVYAFVNHWLDAFLLDPAKYQRKHPHEMFSRCA